MSQLAIVEAFSDLADTRRSEGKRHQQALCFALFTLAVAAGNRGFLAIGDWLKAYHSDLVTLFQPQKGRLPSYSTIRRALLRTEYQAYAACLARFFGIQPLPGETIAMDGKVLRGSYEAISDDETVNSHPAIMLVSAYIVERGLIMDPIKFPLKPMKSPLSLLLLNKWRFRGSSLRLTPLVPKKTAQIIVDSENNYLGALKGNQSGLLEAVKTQFTPEQSDFTMNKGHGRIEKRTVSLSQSLDGIPDFPGLKTLIRVESERQVFRSNIIEVSTETRYYVASYLETASAFGQRLRGYWGVENKVHHVRDVTQGEDASRTRTAPLIQIWAIARNVSLNLYRDFGFQNMAQAQRLASFSLNTLKLLFRME